ncbi:NAD(P)/FAD-dependent oxidoreductase [Propioniferax innocua]|uniref:Sarcosine oxidase subunit beta n=1 Tax=Propioniferax innocua TaxID=1753 RepID=A0A542ZQ77_9ACTN|nr:FAD-binding oxidoreductase [Propioniferax innocua]TQL62521.1 sarcosine oxidase subunit beta [Propioniferax innocua]
MTTIPKQASVVIIGGGIMGVATAYELAAAGIRDVVLLDKGGFGEASTCRAAGGIRAQFSDEVNVQLGARSLEIFENFETLFDQAIDLHQVGYLFLLDDDEAVDMFTANAELQTRLGLESHIISPAEAKKLSPQAVTGDLVAAAWTPRDGHCTPESVVVGYVRAARKAGARLISGCAATDIDIVDGRIAGVQTVAGPIATDTVICAAGAWSKEVGEWAGVTLPIEPLRRQILITEPIEGLAADTPFTIDHRTGLYFHNEGPGLLMGMSYRGEEPGFCTSMSDDWLEDLCGAMERRIPHLQDVGFCSGWAGLYENTPDHNALIGQSSAVPGFFYAAGFSGHGFLQGPAIGEVMRDLVRGEQPFVDVSSFNADRFAGNTWRPELNIV